MIRNALVVKEDEDDVASLFLAEAVIDVSKVYTEEVVYEDWRKTMTFFDAFQQRKLIKSDYRIIFSRKIILF